MTILARHPSNITVDAPIEIWFRKAGSDDIWPTVITRCVRLKENPELAFVHYGKAEVPDDLYLLFLYTDWLDKGK